MRSLGARGRLALLGCVAALVGVALALCSSAATAGVQPRASGHITQQSCVTQVFRGSGGDATADPGSAPGSVTGPFGALQRPAASSDSYTAQPALPELLGSAGASSFDPDKVRQLTSSDGNTVYIVPVTLRPIVASADCSGIPGIDSLLKLQTAQYGSGAGLCVISASGNGVGTADCVGISALDSYYGAARIITVNGGGAYAIVPDGVSRVDIEYTGRTPQSGVVSSNLGKLPYSGDVAVEGMSPADARSTLESELPSAIEKFDASGKLIGTFQRPGGAVDLYLAAEGFVTGPEPKPVTSTVTTVTLTTTPATSTTTAKPTTKSPTTSKGSKGSKGSKSSKSSARASCTAAGRCTAVFTSKTCKPGSTATSSRCTTVTERTVCTATHRCRTAVTTAKTTTTTRQEPHRAQRSSAASVN